MQKIALFASGTGTNAENIILYFQNKELAKVEVVFCNNPNAKVIEKANRNQIPVVLFSKKDLDSDFILNHLKVYELDLIVLVGFLLKIPTSIIEHFPNKIVNLHPALLPNYGGKGMFGNHVHVAVLNNKEKETGITIHYVNEHYDQGDIIFQSKIDIMDCKNSDEIAKKVHFLEQRELPKVIENLLMK